MEIWVKTYTGKNIYKVNGFDITEFECNLITGDSKWYISYNGKDLGYFNTEEEAKVTLDKIFEAIDDLAQHGGGVLCVDFTKDDE